MPYQTIRCMICKDNDTWFSSPFTDEGKKRMTKHMDEEHDTDVSFDE